MTKLDVLSVLRAAKPACLTAGQVMGRLPDEGYVARVLVIDALTNLEHEGLVERVSDESDSPAEWRAL